MLINNNQNIKLILSYNSSNYLHTVEHLSYFQFVTITLTIAEYIYSEVFFFFHTIS